MKLETARRNFKKDGVIYGALEKDFNIVQLIRFDDWKEAMFWFSEPDIFDFRTKTFHNERKGRELVEEGFTTFDCDKLRKERDAEEREAEFWKQLNDEEEKEMQAFYNSFKD